MLISDIGDAYEPIAKSVREAFFYVVHQPAHSPTRRRTAHLHTSEDVSGYALETVRLLVGAGYLSSDRLSDYQLNYPACVLLRISGLCVQHPRRPKSD